MDLRVERLKGYRTSPAVTLLAILKEYSRSGRSAVMCLVEGKDAAYYRPAVKQEFSSVPGVRVVFFNCQGKRNVLSVNVLVDINLSLKDAFIISFIDRDYDEELCEINRSNCFVTDGYSVENYYTTKETFEDILSSEFFKDIHSGNSVERQIYSIVSLYERRQVEFHAAICLFNYWLFINKCIRVGSRPNLNSIDNKRLVGVKLDRVVCYYDSSLLEVEASCSEHITPAEMKQAIEWFATRNFIEAFRGKQEVQFMIDFLIDLSKRAADGEDPFSHKCKTSFRIYEKEFLSDFSQYAKRSRSLIAFLTGARERFVSLSSNETMLVDNE